MCPGCKVVREFIAEGIAAGLNLGNSSCGGDVVMRDSDATISTLYNAQIAGLLDVANSKCIAFRAAGLRAAAPESLARWRLRMIAT
jgi:hypothetical protein